MGICRAEAAKAVVRRNTEEVQGGGDFALFDELFADDFLDHTPQPGRTADKAGQLRRPPGGPRWVSRARAGW
ncbi:MULTISPECIES: hypothetical protein [unclassified Streptomyces]|uniref:hypothetical protein n=1 Tax=unclassified Streptomyces TaxID=2593676 RepID=UPI002E32BD6F|nr:hypothetical protein [Streptomyces sp. NBC_01362]